MRAHISGLLLLVGGAACGQVITNGSFENWGTPGGCSINTAANFWTNYSSILGGPDEGNLGICPSTIPPLAAEGGVYARCTANSNGGEGMRQNVSGFTIGSTYTLSFSYAGSDLFAGTDDVEWHIYLDDVDVDHTPAFHSTDEFWTPHAYVFIATATTHNVGLRLASVNGPAGSAGIDAVGLTTGTTGVPGDGAHQETLVRFDPLANTLVIRLEMPAHYELTVYDMASRAVLSWRANGTQELSVQELRSGAYVYELRNGQQQLERRRFLKY